MKELFASILLISFGVILFVLSCFLYKKAKDSKRWNKVRGLIIKAFTDEFCIPGEQSSFKAKIRYSYIILDKEYYSNRIYFGDFLRDSFSIMSKKMVNKYKKQDVVDVYYNPDNPNDSVLQQGIHFNVIFIFISSLVLISIGIVLLCRIF